MERFWKQVQKTDSCWIWTGAIHSVKTRYGTFTIKTAEGKWARVYAHRFAYELLVGEIPSGQTIDHLCKNRLCVNPKHMEVVSRGENSLRGSGPAAVNKRKTHCKKGHPLSGENLLVTGGARQCRECGRARWRRCHTVGEP